MGAGVLFASLNSFFFERRVAMSTTSITKRHIIIVSIVLAFLLSVQAQAVIYPFAPIYENAPPAVADQMALQLSMGVEAYGTEQVEFIFYNNLSPGYTIESPSSPLPGIITGVFFEDGFLDSLDLDVAYPDPSSGVDFYEKSSGDIDPAPWGLPLGSGHSFEATSVSGVNGGAEPGEGVGIVFSLNGGDISDIYDAISAGFAGDLAGDSLRIGIHVQNYGTGEEYSDAFILTPIPPSVIIGLLGMGIAGIKLRKFA